MGTSEHIRGHRWKRGKWASCPKGMLLTPAKGPEDVCRCRETPAGEIVANEWTCSWASTADTRPKCLRCGRNEFLTRVPHGSERDGEHICGMCFDELLHKVIST